ncbi:MAG: methylated-DNA--[protein]-cysteine S-methyltransferase [Defluviitaleaceae bacterium]|nr:methylated-DNA--[protein]-cysteine S-methyltransferase [Defluviitaleaceae bacterium]
MYFSTKHQLPVGLITLASDGENLVGAWLEGQKYYGESVPGVMAERDDLPIFNAAKKWLDRYFAGKKPTVSELPLAPVGSFFRQEIWRILCEIPYGEVTTYGDIAKKIKKNSAQAVGGAVGHNPISIIIPCHRVVGAKGQMTGYAGGIETKIKLLELEGVDL